MGGSKIAAGIVVAALAALALVGAGPAKKAKPEAYAPKFDPANFQARVDHPYFPLVPGTRYVYREESDDSVATIEITVLSETKTIEGVSCTIVHDVERIGSRTLEETWDWYAQDKQGNVWYMGEDTREYDDGEVDTEGSWQSGVKGAHGGILMPADLKPGEPYRQEYLKGVVEDMGQVVAVGDTVTVPAGRFAGCVKTKDWSALEPGHEHKWYAKGVGFVRSESSEHEVAELVSVTSQ